MAEIILILQTTIPDPSEPEQRRAHWGPNTEYGCANCPPTFKHCARLKMRFYDCHLSSNLTSFEQRLSLYNACVTTIFKSGEDKGRTVSFVSAFLNVLVIHSQFNTKKNGQVRIDFKRDTDEDIGQLTCLWAILPCLLAFFR